MQNGGMRWVWRGRIDKCAPNSEKLGVQYGPTAAGRRSVLHPQFRRMRFALSMCPSQTHRIYIVIDKLKPATFLLDSFRLWTSNSKTYYVFFELLFLSYWGLISERNYKCLFQKSIALSIANSYYRSAKNNDQYFPWNCNIMKIKHKLV